MYFSLLCVNQVFKNEIILCFHLKCLSTYYIQLIVSFWIVVVQFLGRAQFFATPWTAVCQASLSFTIKLMSVKLVMLSSHLILCHHCLLLPSIFPSIKVFSNELALHIRWPEYQSSNFSISPSNEYSELIPFGLTGFDLPAVQETLKSLFQHHNVKASVPQCSVISCKLDLFS